MFKELIESFTDDYSWVGGLAIVGLMVLLVFAIPNDGDGTYKVTDHNGVEHITENFWFRDGGGIGFKDSEGNTVILTTNFKYQKINN